MANYSDFVIEEYRALRQEIIEEHESAHRVLGLGGVVSAALLSILAKTWGDSESFNVFAFLTACITLPISLITIYTATKCFTARTERVGDYLLWLEKKIARSTDNAPPRGLESAAHEYVEKSQQIADPKLLIAPLSWESWIRVNKDQKSTFYNTRRYRTVCVPIAAGLMGVMFLGSKYLYFRNGANVFGSSFLGITSFWPAIAYAGVLLVASLAYRSWLLQTLERHLGRPLTDPLDP